jgi:hypothetical protein
MGRLRCFAKVSNRPILLKKSAIVSTAEKYALEIEIFTLSRGFQAQISRSCTQKRDFQQSVRGRSGKSDFFNGIGQKPPVGPGGFQFASVIQNWDIGKRLPTWARL